MVGNGQGTKSSGYKAKISVDKLLKTVQEYANKLNLNKIGDICKINST